MLAARMAPNVLSWPQAAFMTLPDVLQSAQTSHTGFMAQSQLYMLVSFFVLQRHNLFLLRIHRMDYLLSSRRRLNFLPQGNGNDSMLLIPARARMLALTESILKQLERDDDLSESANSAHAPFPMRSASAASAAVSSRSSAARAEACSHISTLVRYLNSSVMSSPQVCNLSDICRAAISTCMPLQNESSVVLKYAGRQRCLPLRVLLVDDQEFVLKRLQRLVRNRGYHYKCCTSVESCVKVFEESLQSDARACGRFDLILMDKEMPILELNAQDIDRKAGADAVRRLRELSLLQAGQEPGFRCPCIVGNTACTDEDDPTMIEFRRELELSRQQAGMQRDQLIQERKMSSWSDEFDRDVRRQLGMDDVLPPEAEDVHAPTVWGNPDRLQMIFYNLITNAIVHGKPADGEHCVCVSYDVIDSRARMHPCLMGLDRDEEVQRSISWQLKAAFEEGAQCFVQVMVVDNGPGIDVHNERMRRSLGFDPPTASSAHAALGDVNYRGAAGASLSPGSSVSNLGIGLQRVVCPEVASNRGAMGVHSRSEPDTGCSFVVALPHYKTC